MTKRTYNLLGIPVVLGCAGISMIVANLLNTTMGSWAAGWIAGICYMGIRDIMKAYTENGDTK